MLQERCAKVQDTCKCYNFFEFLFLLHIVNVFDHCHFPTNWTAVCIHEYTKSCELQQWKFRLHTPWSLGSSCHSLDRLYPVFNTWTSNTPKNTYPFWGVCNNAIVAHVCVTCSTNDTMNNAWCKNTKCNKSANFDLEWSWRSGIFDKLLSCGGLVAILEKKHTDWLRRFDHCLNRVSHAPHDHLTTAIQHSFVCFGVIVILWFVWRLLLS
jgi:hypothetical protein